MVVSSFETFLSSLISSSVLYVWRRVLHQNIKMALGVVVRWACMLLLARTHKVQAFEFAIKLHGKLHGKHCSHRMSQLRSTTPVEVTPVRVITSKLFLSHKPPKGRSHPECPERLELAWKRLESDGSAIEWATPGAEPSKPNAPKARADALAAVERVHELDYVRYLEAVCRDGGGQLDSDTYIAPLSYEVALLAQSAWLDAVEHTLATNQPSFALVRPPGHHAVKAHGMGFCTFNFVSAAAVNALEMHGSDKGIQKVAILDWDVHHGNGVQALLGDDPRVAYCSLHEEGGYPRTGLVTETGASNNVLNVPLPSGCQWPQYEVVMKERVLPWLEDFQPDLVFVSAGFDALATDHLAGMNLNPSDFGKMATMLREGSWGDKLVLGLEGGYSLDPNVGLGEAISETCRALGAPKPGDVKTSSEVASSGTAAVYDKDRATGVESISTSESASGSLSTSSALMLRSLWLRDFGFREAWSLLRSQRIGKREFAWSRALRFKSPPLSS